MEFENRIKNYSDCQNCKLVQDVQIALGHDPNVSDKHVILTQCLPKLSAIGLHSATLAGLVNDKGRLERLVNLHPNEGVIFWTPTIKLTYPGVCEPLIRQTVENMTGKILNFFHLK